MKQIDNRQKQVIQSRAQKAFLRSKNPFVQKGKEKEHVHIPLEKPHQAEEGSEKQGIQEAATYHPGPKVGRNDPCPCGSGKKYKKCCLNSPK